MKFFTVCSLNSLRQSRHRGNNSATRSSWVRVVARSKRCPQAELRTCSGVIAAGLRPILPDTNSKSSLKRTVLSTGSSLRRDETTFCGLVGVEPTTLLAFCFGAESKRSPESEALSPNMSSDSSKAAFFLRYAIYDFRLVPDKTKPWQLLTDRRLVDEPVGTSRSRRSELPEPHPVKSECLHEGPSANRRPSLPLLPPLDHSEKTLGSKWLTPVPPLPLLLENQRNRSRNRKPKSLLSVVKPLSFWTRPLSNTCILTPHCTSPHHADRGYFRSHQTTSRLSQICQYRI